MTIRIILWNCYNWSHWNLRWQTVLEWGGLYRSWMSTLICTRLYTLHTLKELFITHDALISIKQDTTLAGGKG